MINFRVRFVTLCSFEESLKSMDFIHPLVTYLQNAFGFEFLFRALLLAGLSIYWLYSSTVCLIKRCRVIKSYGNWKTVSAEVIYSDVMSYGPDDTSLVLVYKYIIDGVTYKSSNSCDYKLQKKYPVGMVISIHYNPEKPKETYIFYSGYMNAITGFLFSVIGGLVMIPIIIIIPLKYIILCLSIPLLAFTAVFIQEKFFFKRYLKKNK